MNPYDPLTPHDPFPIAPRHGAVVDGSRLSLQWEESPGADAYAIEIAEDQEFHHVIYTRELPASALALEVDETLPTDDRTLYWRVSAGNAQGWSEGERIESFIAGTPEQAGRFVDPDEVEPFGPIEAILRHPIDPGSPS
jgi:hypothetical protein